MTVAGAADPRQLRLAPGPRAPAAPREPGAHARRVAARGEQHAADVELAEDYGSRAAHLAQGVTGQVELSDHSVAWLRDGLAQLRAEAATLTTGAEAAAELLRSLETAGRRQRRRGVAELLSVTLGDRTRGQAQGLVERAELHLTACAALARRWASHHSDDDDAALGQDGVVAELVAVGLELSRARTLLLELDDLAERLDDPAQLLRGGAARRLRAVDGGARHSES